ncbi:MAG: dephospho-CoA kinase [Actinomycetales bacterium]|nr:dephospho-CoA kinase [Actinomycetales bacterium]
MTFQVGLTGGIASGKSTVSRLFASAGFTVIDYDVIAREVVAPGSVGLKRIVQAFGPDYIDDHGNMDRVRMGALVFSDKNALAQLEAITHPLIQAVVAKRVDLVGSGVVVHDNPLLVEMGTFRNCDLVVVVDVPRETQIQRMINDRGMTRHEAELRLANQTGSSERMSVADIVIDNSHDIGALQDRVVEVVAQIAVAAEQRD